jgi:hypothetical protein
MPFLFQDEDVRQISVPFVVVKSIAHQETFFDLKAAIIENDLLATPFPFIN